MTWHRERHPAHPAAPIPASEVPAISGEKIQRSGVFDAMQRIAPDYFPPQAPFHALLARESAKIQTEQQTRSQEDARGDDFVAMGARGLVEGRIIQAIAAGNTSEIEIQVPRIFAVRREVRERKAAEYRQRLQTAAQAVIGQVVPAEGPGTLIEEHLRLARTISAFRGVLDFFRRNSADIGAGIAVAAPIPFIGIPALAIRGKVNKVAKREDVYQWNPQTGRFELTPGIRADDQRFRQAFNEYRRLKPKVLLKGPAWTALEQQAAGKYGKVARGHEFAGKVWEVKKIPGLGFGALAWGAMRRYLFAYQSPEDYARTTQSAAYYRIFNDYVTTQKEQPEGGRR